MQIGPRAIGFVEDDVDAIIDELVAERDATGGDPSMRNRPLKRGLASRHVAVCEQVWLGTENVHR